MKSHLVWFFSVIKFFLVKKRFLLLSPPFLKKQFWYDRLSKKKFTTINRNKIDWGTSWQVFLDEQFSLLKNIYNDSREKDLKDYINYCIAEKKRPLIIDCGSNSGASCIYFSLTFPEAKVIGVEIDKENCKHSEENIKLNGLDVSILNNGISSENGKGFIANPEEDNNSFRIEDNGLIQNEVSMIDVDSLLKIFDKEEFMPFLIKIDIEGGEKELFEKNTDWVNAFPFIIIELHDWLYPKERTSSNFLKTICNKDRDFNIKGENIFSIKNKLLD